MYIYIWDILEWCSWWYFIPVKLVRNWDHGKMHSFPEVWRTTRTHHFSNPTTPLRSVYIYLIECRPHCSSYAASCPSLSSVLNDAFPFQLVWWGFPVHGLWQSPIQGGMTPCHQPTDFFKLLSWARGAYFADGARSFRCNVSEHVRDHPLRKVVGLGAFSLGRLGHPSELLGIIVAYW